MIILDVIPIENYTVYRAESTPLPSNPPSSLILGTFGRHQSPCRQYWELMYCAFTGLGTRVLGQCCQKCVYFYFLCSRMGDSNPCTLRQSPFSQIVKRLKWGSAAVALGFSMTNLHRFWCSEPVLPKVSFKVPKCTKNFSYQLRFFVMIGHDW